MGNTLAVNYVKLGRLERRGNLILDHLYARPVAYNIVAVLDAVDLPYVEPYRRVILQRPPACRRLGVPVHYADFFTELVYEYAAGVGLADVRRELSQGLAHKPCLETHFRIAHLSFDLCLRGEGCHGVDDNDVDRAGAYEVVRDFKGLFSVVRLGYVKVIHINTDILGINRIECMLRIEIPRDRPIPLNQHVTAPDGRQSPRSHRSDRPP